MGLPVICIPGLSANLRGFDFIAERIAGEARPVVTLDLRGRATAMSPNPHIRVGEPREERARCRGCSRCHALRRHRAVDGRVRGDGDRPPRARTAECRCPHRCVRRARPGRSAPHPCRGRAAGHGLSVLEAYLALVQRLGTIRPWSPYWERYFATSWLPSMGASAPAVIGTPSSKMRPTGRSTTHGPLALSHDARPPAARDPAARRRGGVHRAPGRARQFPRPGPSARLVEIDANHYGINTHPEASQAIADFLG